MCNNNAGAASENGEPVDGAGALPTVDGAGALPQSAVVGSGGEAAGSSGHHHHSHHGGHTGHRGRGSSIGSRGVYKMDYGDPEIQVRAEIFGRESVRQYNTHVLCIRKQASSFFSGKSKRSRPLFRLCTRKSRATKARERRKSSEPAVKGGKAKQRAQKQHCMTRCTAVHTCTPCTKLIPFGLVFLPSFKECFDRITVLSIKRSDFPTCDDDYLLLLGPFGQRGRRGRSRQLGQSIRVPVVVSELRRGPGQHLAVSLLVLPQRRR